jgi:hypothetical protein
VALHGYLRDGYCNEFMVFRLAKSVGVRITFYMVFSMAGADIIDTSMQTVYFISLDTYFFLFFRLAYMLLEVRSWCLLQGEKFRIHVSRSAETHFI